MNDLFDKFKAFPPSFQKSFFFLISAWGCHFAFIYYYFTISTGELPSDILTQQAVIGGLILILLFIVKKWARILCILCNVLIVVLYGFVVALVYQNKLFIFLCIATIILFCLSTYWLVVKETGEFFRLQNPTIEKPD